jgi:hypothetical protein
MILNLEKKEIEKKTLNRPMRPNISQPPLTLSRAPCFSLPAATFYLLSLLPTETDRQDTSAERPRAPGARALPSSLPRPAPPAAPCQDQEPQKPSPTPTGRAQAPTPRRPQPPCPRLEPDALHSRARSFDCATDPGPCAVPLLSATCAQAPDRAAPTEAPRHAPEAEQPASVSASLWIFTASVNPSLHSSSLNAINGRHEAPVAVSDPSRSIKTPGLSPSLPPKFSLSRSPLSP